MKFILQLQRLFIILLLLSCAEDEIPPDPVEEESFGMLKGNTGIFTGNCMPGPGSPDCFPEPIEITIAITKPSDTFREDIHIKNVRSSADGKFETQLPVGVYSLFLYEGEKYICSAWQYTGESYCSPVKIRKDSVSEVSLTINRAAW